MSNPRWMTLLVAAVLVLPPLATADRMHPRSAPRAGRQANVKYEAEMASEYWNDKAQAILRDKLEQLKEAQPARKAKNVILFIGDGMSMQTITATRNLLGDSSAQLQFERFPYVGISKTYCLDRQVADSACTSTAYFGGVKANYGTIGLNGQAKRYSCTDGQNPAFYVDGMAKWALDAHKAAGLVTTSRVTHASPAGVFAHTTNRNWENDVDVVASGCSPDDVPDIARQLVEGPVGQSLRVVLGGGRSNFRAQSQRGEEGEPGARSDGRDLVAEWLRDRQLRGHRAQYVWSRTGLQRVDVNQTEYLLGLFSRSHCPYEGDRVRGKLEQADPSLSEMTAAAIRVLSAHDDGNGFFLFVEGARIDMAHHDTLARKALEDTAEMARAVQVAQELTSQDDTLIVVTSDHSHTMTINGYPRREQAITGLSSKDADDGRPFSILSYANGPSYYDTYTAAEGRSAIVEREMDEAAYRYPSAVPLDAETHGGDDVPVFAVGPYAQFFSGNYEQTNIPAMMAKAAGIGPFADA